LLGIALRFFLLEFLFGAVARVPLQNVSLYQSTLLKRRC
jgi:hypothetical protein